MPAATTNYSLIVALDEDGYYSPATGETIDDSTGAIMAEVEHARGILVSGMDFTLGGGLPHSVTADENQANLTRAFEVAAAQVGIGINNRGSWTQQQIVDLVKAQAAIILANPNSFTPATVAIAQNTRVQPDLSADAGRQIIDPELITVAITDFMMLPINAVMSSMDQSGVADAARQAAQAAKDLASLLGNTASVLKWAVPGAALLFLWYSVKSASRDPGGQAGKFIAGSAKGVRTLLPY